MHGPHRNNQKEAVSKLLSAWACLSADNPGEGRQFEWLSIVSLGLSKARSTQYHNQTEFWDSLFWIKPRYYHGLFLNLKWKPRWLTASSQ